VEECHRSIGVWDGRLRIRLGQDGGGEIVHGEDNIELPRSRIRQRRSMCCAFSFTPSVFALTPQRGSKIVLSEQHRRIEARQTQEGQYPNASGPPLLENHFTVMR
jgi:hypothetical protein